MKKNFLLMALFAIATIGLAGCSNNKTENTDVTSETEQVTEAPTEFDFEGLEALTKKSNKEVTSADYDFLLDQAEIFAKKVHGLSKEEMETYKKNMSGDELGAIIVISMGLSTAKKKGALSEEQLKRFEQIEALSQD